MIKLFKLDSVVQLIPVGQVGRGRAIAKAAGVHKRADTPTTFAACFQFIFFKLCFKTFFTPFHIFYFDIFKIKLFFLSIFIITQDFLNQVNKLVTTRTITKAKTITTRPKTAHCIIPLADLA